MNMPALGPALRILGCLAFAGLVLGAVPAPEQVRTGLALFALIGALWVTQALPLAVTALLVPLLAVLSGLSELRPALAAFAHPVIFLFLGGFALAAALQRQGLDLALATAVLRLADGRRPVAVALLFLLTAGLSMWISNTATAALMLPLALGLLGDTRGTEPAGPAERSFVLLGVAYSASIGGVGTIVGSPPNAIAAAQAGIGFAQWLRIGLPLVVVLLPLMVVVLFLMLRPRLAGRLPVTTSSIAWSRERRATLVVFMLTAAGWIGGAPLGRALGIDADIDSVVALAAIVALVATGALGWKDIESRTHWGVLLLFGGGLALGHVMDTSGASSFLADGLVARVRDAPVAWLIVAVVAFVVFLTELVSNTASAALLVPVFLGVGSALGLPPQLLASAIAIAASCAFMLPVATPPNAIVFATEWVPQATMMRCGFVLNLLCIAVIAGTAIMVWR